MNFLEHLTRITDSIDQRYSITTLAPWIQKNTFIDGKPFSFKDHEYQLDIIGDTSNTILVNKAAQTGLSEIFARWALGVCCTQRNFTVIWTFPSATDASNFTKARLAPIIGASDEIKRCLSATVDSSELKQFNSDTFLYIRGTISETAGLSVPADVLIHDELDRSDVGNVSAYVSRLQHKPTKVRRLFSTPTVSGFGIDLECRTARRKRQVWKCSHCNTHFLPSYEDHIIIPGWDKSKKEINRHNIKDVRWKEAKLLCPHCGKEPATDVEFRQWVIENNEDKYEPVAYYVSPFCAPAIITPSYLVKVSTDFNKWSEFVNQALGLVADDEEEALTIGDIERSCVQGIFRSSDLHVMGVDIGLVCHITIAKLTDEKLIVTHRERVPFNRFIERRRELCAEWRVVSSVHDMYPYTDLVDRITKFDPNAYGAIYGAWASTETHKLREVEADREEGKLNVRAVRINREVAFDSLMWMFKRGEVIIGNGDDEFKLHMLDMKRIQKFDKTGGIVYKWEKTSGHDHWHHSLLYALMAARIRTKFTWADPGVVPLVSSFRVRQ